MRQFVKLDLSLIVIGFLESDRIPGDGGTLPANWMEVTGRNDGPWVGKQWNPGPQTFTVPPTTKEDLKQLALAKYHEWSIMRETLSGASGHNEASGVINFLTTQENNTWTAYKTAMQAWIAAP